MKVAEFRQLIGALQQALTSLKCAANAAEREREADWVRRAALELSAADAPRATAYDRQRKESLLDQSASYLIERGLDAASVAARPAQTSEPAGA